LKEIEGKLIELAQMFQDLDTLVIQQEAAVQNIEQQGEQVVENVEKANVHMEGAITSATAARKKKWICLGIAGKFLICEIATHQLTCHSPNHHHHHCHRCGGGVDLAEVKDSISFSIRIIILSQKWEQYFTRISASADYNNCGKD
jgi:SNARE domain